MISPGAFVEHLVRHGFRYFTGVPCSYFKDVLRMIDDRSDLTYCIAPNEGSALAFASGVHLGRQGAVVMIQNSGLGNLINPLTSLNSVYRIPIPIFISGRGYGVRDEPQHEIMGKNMTELLTAIGIKFWELPQEVSTLKRVLDGGLKEMANGGKPVVFLIKKGTFSSYESRKPEPRSDYSLKRIDAISIIRESFSRNDFVFVTTGKPSRELFTLADRPRNFYMQGSMGHVGSLALGTAIAQPDRRMIVIDGDGAFLMHMGATSMIGHVQPKNFFHLLLDNESHESTGNQNTTSPTTNFTLVAKACGYRFSEQATNAEELRQALAQFLKQEGPAFLRIKINRLPSADLPRITTRYTAPQIAGNFLRSVDMASHSKAEA